MKHSDLVPHEKIEGAWIHRAYRFYKDSGKDIQTEYRDDVFLMESMPSVEWNSELSMYELTVLAPDFGGYDICSLYLYFDTWGEIKRFVLNSLERNLYDIRTV